MASLANPDPRITVLVADAVAMSCRLLAEALQRSKRFLAEAAVTTTQLREALERMPYQVLLISPNFAANELTGMGLVREICDRYPRLNTVVLLDAPEHSLVVEAFRSGACGVFCRSDSFQALCKCITCVHEGQVWASSEELQFVLAALVEPAPLENRGMAGARPLSKREEEIARLVAEGLSNREISLRLQLSEHTIKNYLFRVFEKLGVGTRVELALYAVKRGHVRRSASAIHPSLEDVPLSS